MQLRRKVLIGVLSAGLVGSAVMVSRPATAQDAPPATQPSTRPARDPVTMTLAGMGHRLERLDGMTDDQKKQIDDLLADTATKLDGILTDEQKQQLQTQMQQMRNRWGGGGGGGGGRQHGGGGGGGAAGGGAGGGAPGQ